MQIDAPEGKSGDVGVQSPVAVVETDVYCPTCGYNLHQQVVSRDERLGLLVTRCPECGRFAAATALTGITHRAMHRLAVGGLVLYVLFALYLCVMVVMGLGAMQYLYAEEMSRAVRAVEEGYQATTPPLGEQVIMFSLASGLAFATGVIVAAFMWHWRRRWWILVGLLPLLIGVVVNQMWQADMRGRQPGNKTVSHLLVLTGFSSIASVAVAEAAALAVALILGRIISRLILGIVLPPGLRQKFAFLWLVDGKALPRANPRTHSGKPGRVRGNPNDETRILESNPNDE